VVVAAGRNKAAVQMACSQASEAALLQELLPDRTRSTREWDRRVVLARERIKARPPESREWSWTRGRGGKVGDWAEA